MQGKWYILIDYFLSSVWLLNGEWIVEGQGGSREQFGSVCRGPGNAWVETWLRMIVVELETCRWIGD